MHQLFYCRLNKTEIESLEKLLFGCKLVKKNYVKLSIETAHKYIVHRKENAKRHTKKKRSSK